MTLENKSCLFPLLFLDALRKSVDSYLVGRAITMHVEMVIEFPFLYIVQFK